MKLLNAIFFCFLFSSSSIAFAIEAPQAVTVNTQTNIIYKEVNQAAVKLSAPIKVVIYHYLRATKRYQNVTGSIVVTLPDQQDQLFNYQGISAREIRLSNAKKNCLGKAWPALSGNDILSSSKYSYSVICKHEKTSVTYNGDISIR